MPIIQKATIHFCPFINGQYVPALTKEASVRQTKAGEFFIMRGRKKIPVRMIDDKTFFTHLSEWVSDALNIGWLGQRNLYATALLSSILFA